MDKFFTDGKTPVLRDISNIKYKMKNRGAKDSLSETLNILRDNGELHEYFLLNNYLYLLDYIVPLPIHKIIY